MAMFRSECSFVCRRPPQSPGSWDWASWGRDSVCCRRGPGCRPPLRGWCQPPAEAGADTTWEVHRPAERRLTLSMYKVMIIHCDIWRFITGSLCPGVSNCCGQRTGASLCERRQQTSGQPPPLKVWNKFSIGDGFWLMLTDIGRTLRSFTTL